MPQREWLMIQIDSVITIQYQMIYRHTSNDNSCHRDSKTSQKDDAPLMEHQKLKSSFLIKSNNPIHSHDQRKPKIYSGFTFKF